jgi:hypothetical protein
MQKEVAHFAKPCTLVEVTNEDEITLRLSRGRPRADHIGNRVLVVPTSEEP